MVDYYKDDTTVYKLLKDMVGVTVDVALVDNKTKTFEIIPITNNRITYFKNQCKEANRLEFNSALVSLLSMGLVRISVDHV